MVQKEHGAAAGWKQETALTVECPGKGLETWPLTHRQAERVSELQAQGMELRKAIFQAREEVPGPKLVPEPMVPISHYIETSPRPPKKDPKQMTKQDWAELKKWMDDRIRCTYRLTEAQCDRMNMEMKQGRKKQDAISAALTEVPTRWVTEEEYAAMMTSDFFRI